MKEHDINIFIENYMRQIFDDADIYLNTYYDICSLQCKGKLQIKYGEFNVVFDILIDEYYAEKQIVDFCNHVVGSIKEHYIKYLREGEIIC